jgi:glycosyltransferase involved in cell wall biosynthesis
MNHEILFDSTFRNNQTGIGQDAKVVFLKLGESFSTKYYSPKLIELLDFVDLRKLTNLLSLVSPIYFRMSSTHRGTFYQPQVSSIVAGKNIGSWIIRIHDIFPITNPEWYPWKSRVLFKRNFDRAVRLGAIFLCSSEFARNSIIKLYPELKGRIAISFCEPREISNEFCQNCEGCNRLNFLSDRKFVLAVGTIEPRKNYHGLIEVWQGISRVHEDINLVIVGGPGWKTRRVQKRLRNSIGINIFWLPSACDGSLNELYSRCFAYLSTSFEEGFNLPALEARALYRKPLVLSNIEVHREFHSDSALFFENPSQLVGIFHSTLREPQVWEPNKIEINVSLLDLITSLSGRTT